MRRERRSEIADTRACVRGCAWRDNSQAGQYVGEPSLWIDVECGGGNEGVDCSRTPGTLIGAGEGPISSAHGDSSKLALGGIVRHAKPWSSRKWLSASQRLSLIVVPGELGALVAQPRLPAIRGRLRSWRTRKRSLRSKTVDLALDGEQSIDALDHLCRDRRL